MKDEIAGPSMTLRKSDRHRIAFFLVKKDRRAQIEQRIQVGSEGQKAKTLLVETTFSINFRLINQLLPRNLLVVDKLCF